MNVSCFKVVDLAGTCNPFFNPKPRFRFYRVFTGLYHEVAYIRPTFIYLRDFFIDLPKRCYYIIYF